MNSMADSATESVADLVSALRERGVRLWVEDGQVRYRAAKGGLSPDIRHYLGSRKLELVEYLGSCRQFDEPTAPAQLQDATGTHPLTHVQEVFVRAYELLADPRGLHIALAFRLTGPLSTEALQSSIDELVRRHAAFRTRYVRQNGEYRAIVENAGTVTIGVVDATQASAPEREERTTTFLDAGSSPRFDVSQPGLLRVQLLRLADDNHVLLIVIHHSITDAWSMSIILSELSACYASFALGAPPNLPLPSVELTDLARSHREWMKSEIGRQARAYWNTRLRDIADPFWLPRDRPAERDRSDGHTTLHGVGGASLNKLRELAHQETTTLFVLVLAALAVVFSLWSGRRHVLMGITHFGRSRPQLYGVVGCLARGTPLPATVDWKSSFRETVRAVKAQYLEGLLHQDVPYMLLRQDLQERSSENPMLDIMINYLPHDTGSNQANAVHLRWGNDVVVTPLQWQKPQPLLEESSLNKLRITVLDGADAVAWDIKYVASIFSDSTVENASLCLRSLLEHAASDPDRAIGVWSLPKVQRDTALASGEQV